MTSYLRFLNCKVEILDSIFNFNSNIKKLTIGIDLIDFNCCGCCQVASVVSDSVLKRKYCLIGKKACFGRPLLALLRIARAGSPDHTKCFQPSSQIFGTGSEVWHKINFPNLYIQLDNKYSYLLLKYVVVQLLSRVLFLATPWTAAHQASLSISWSLLKLMSAESVMPSSHLVLCRPLPLCLQSFPAAGYSCFIMLLVSGVQQSDSVIHIYVCSFSNSFPIWVITEKRSYYQQ